MFNNAVYIIPSASFLNPEIVNTFENFSIEDSKFLKSILYLNLIENFLADEKFTVDYFHGIMKNKGKSHVRSVFEGVIRDELLSCIIEHAHLNEMGWDNRLDYR